TTNCPINQVLYNISRRNIVELQNFWKGVIKKKNMKLPTVLLFSLIASVVSQSTTTAEDPIPTTEDPTTTTWPTSTEDTMTITSPTTTDDHTILTTATTESTSAEVQNTTATITPTSAKTDDPTVTVTTITPHEIKPSEKAEATMTSDSSNGLDTTYSSNDDPKPNAIIGPMLPTGSSEVLEKNENPTTNTDKADPKIMPNNSSMKNATPGILISAVTCMSIFIFSIKMLNHL
ncbi:unnamed protein product, partial [Allacma fusca]